MHIHADQREKQEITIQEVEDLRRPVNQDRVSTLQPVYSGLEMLMLTMGQ